MTRKRALYALAVVVLIGSVACVASADYDWAAGAYKPDPSVTAKPEQDVAQPAMGEIREPVETGAVPALPESSSDLHSNPIGDVPTAEIGGRLFRPGIDDGP